ncbi:MAG: FHA domain-containing protein [Polyangiaceae bacterium]
MPILLELRRGIGEPEQVPLSVGKQLSVGRRGMWRIEGPKVLDIHGYFYYDGVTLFVMSETDQNPVLVNRKEMPIDWTAVKGPAEISMGGVVLSFVGSIGQEDSGITLARVPPPSRQEMTDFDNAPTSHGGGQTIPRGDTRAAQGAPPPSPKPSKPAPKTPTKPPAQPARKPEYVEPPRDLDRTSDVTHIRPDTLERLAADHEEAKGAHAAKAKSKPPEPEPLTPRPPSGGFTMVLPEGVAPPPPAPAGRPPTAPPQAQTPSAARKNEGSGETRFAPLEAPATGSTDAQALMLSGMNAVPRQPLGSGAHFAGPPALYAHQTGGAFVPPGAPWPGQSAPPPAQPSGPSVAPKPGTQDPTVQKLTLGARIRRDWAATSWPRKALLILAPILAWVFLSDDPEDLFMPSKPAATAKATASPTATSSSPTATPSVTATAATPPTAAIIPAPMPTTTTKPTAQPPVPPPGGTAKPQMTTERQAIDALSLGQEAEALKIYETLAKDNPDNPNFKEAARILRKRREQLPPK